MTKPLIILGAGGHGRVLADLLRVNGLDLLGFLDPSVSKGSIVSGYQVLGDDDLLNEYIGTVDLVNGIGSLPSSRQIRRSAFYKAKSLGFYFPPLIHNSAIIAKDVVLAEGVQIMAGAILQTGVQIGSNSIINTAASIDHDCQIENHCHIAPGAVLCGGIKVCDSVSIGAGATIIHGVSIGENSVVALGSVVIESVADNSMVAGVPAKIKKTMTE